MKKTFLIIIFYLLIGNCGRIQNVEEIPFSKEEKAIFDKELKRYQTENLQNMMHIMGTKTDTILIINVLWDKDPEDEDFSKYTTLKHKFYKTNTYFIRRSYEGESFISKEENTNLELLLRKTLK